MTSTCEDIPIVIGEEEFRPEEAARFQVMPFDHQKKIAKYYWATPELIQKAIDNGTAIRLEEDCEGGSARQNRNIRSEGMGDGISRPPIGDSHPALPMQRPLTSECVGITLRECR